MSRLPDKQAHRHTLQRTSYVMKIRRSGISFSVFLCMPVEWRKVQVEALTHLANGDLISLLTISREALTVKNSNQFEHCLEKAKTIMLFDGAISVFMGKEHLEKCKSPLAFFCTLDFSSEFFNKYIRGRYYEKCVVWQAVLASWKPQHWKTAWELDTLGNGKPLMQLAKSYGYLDGWTSAICCWSHCALSVFTFAGKKVDNDQRTATILTYLTPYFAESLKCIFSSSFEKHKAIRKSQVTKRELEVLRWLEQGKSTWDISMILNRSERVIKYHVKNLMHKLSAQNRTHAVAIAIRQGIID